MASMPSTNPAGGASSSSPATNIGRRQKSLSESSDCSSPVDMHDIKYLYDIDGKFPYSVYAKNPQLYDIDGKHTFKYFSQLKHLSSPNVSAAKDQQQQQQQSTALPQENFVYDLDGKFSYTVYNPSLHRSLFTGKSK